MREENRKMLSPLPSSLTNRAQKQTDIAIKIFSERQRQKKRI